MCGGKPAKEGTSVLATTAITTYNKWSQMVVCLSVDFLAHSLEMVRNVSQRI